MSIKSQSIGISIFLVIGLFLNFINGGILFPTILGLTLYGLVRWLTSISSIVTTVFGSGVKRLIVKFYPYYSHNEGLFIGSIIYLLIIYLIIGTSLIFFLKPFLINLIEDDTTKKLSYSYYFAVYIIVLYTLTNQVINGFLQVKLIPSLGTFFLKVISPILISIILILTFYDLIHKDYYIFLYSIHGVFISILLIFFTIKKVSFKKIYFPKLKSLKSNTNYDAFSFLLYSTFSGVGRLVIEKIDIFMITSLISFEATGIYALSLSISNIINIPYNSMNQIVSPKMAALWKSKELHEINSLYKESNIVTQILGGLIFLLILINIDTLIELTGIEIVTIKYVIIVICFSKLIDTYFGFNFNIILHSPKYKFALLFQIITLGLGVILNLKLIAIYGILGAAVATALTLLFNNIMSTSFLLIIYKLSPFNFSTFKVILILFSVSITYYFLPKYTNLIIDSAIKSLLLSVIYSYLIITTKCSIKLNNYIMNTIRGTIFDRLSYFIPK